ncbi:MAG: hypothetical protein EOM20_19020 [Spartobacteria bacterium]|nr:hypothetical protein [Spartobacteria bacterium]
MITPTTEAATSDAFTVYKESTYGPYTIPVTVQLSGAGLGEGEYIRVQYQDGANWRDCVKEGDYLQLDADTNMLTFYGTGVFRLNKSVTSVAHGAALS